jgi:hypothetical protein
LYVKLSKFEFWMKQDAFLGMSSQREVYLWIQARFKMY